MQSIVAGAKIKASVIQYRIPVDSALLVRVVEPKSVVVHRALGVEFLRAGAVEVGGGQGAARALQSAIRINQLVSPISPRGL
jgi:hypothetical protein